ncbi:unnamed protein product [Rotaria sp. Silwood1]|nr:unnamed protein product [Rotaria sp. Silwood1]
MLSENHDYFPFSTSSKVYFRQALGSDDIKQDSGPTCKFYNGAGFGKCVQLNCRFLHLCCRCRGKSLSSTITNRRSIPEKRSFNERSNLSIDRIDSIVTDLFNNTIASTSKTSYSSGYQLFTRFAVMSGFNMHSYHLPHNLILCFIAYCHDICNIRYSTIRSYLAAIRFCRLRSGFSDPFLDMHRYKIP